MYVAIGAHTDKKLRLEGEDSENVISAVAMLREIGDDHYPDYTGRNVVVVAAETLPWTVPERQSAVMRSP